MQVLKQLKSPAKLARQGTVPATENFGEEGVEAFPGLRGAGVTAVAYGTRVENQRTVRIDADVEERKLGGG
nr:hypothetical protein GCM10017547_19910 [Pseudarthrobacter oxydans]